MVAQHMQQKLPHEFIILQRHGFLARLAVGAVILPAKCHAMLIHRDQARVRDGHPGNGRTGLGAVPDNLQLEFGAGEPSLGGLGGASLARHGVHDVHRAHYHRISAVLQYVLAERIRWSARCVSCRVPRAPANP